jgi:RNA polymerase sigma factor (sigma-70 family)
MKINDYEVWQRLKKGDENAVTEIMRCYFADLYKYSLKISKDSDLSKDYIQEIFMEIWNKRAKLADVNYIKPYLFKSLRWRIIRGKMQESKIQSLLDYEVDIVFSYEDTLIQDQLWQEKKENLLQAINLLSKRQREIIYLKFYEGLNYEQIAEIMGIGHQPLYNLLHKSLKTLREYLSASVSLMLWLLFSIFINN